MEITILLNTRIESLFDTPPDAGLFKSLPSIVNCMGSCMLAALGDNRNRFNNTGENAELCRYFTCNRASDQKYWIHWRCRKIRTHYDEAKYLLSPKSLPNVSGREADIMLINDEVVRLDSTFSQFLLKYYDHDGKSRCG